MPIIIAGSLFTKMPFPDDATDNQSTVDQNIQGKMIKTENPSITIQNFKYTAICKEQHGELYLINEGNESSIFQYCRNSV